ncbi:MAG: TIM44-like domain-containing protein [Acidimicrobiales bacterium]
MTAPVTLDLALRQAVVGALPSRAGGGQSSNSGSSGSSSRSSGSSSRSSGSSSGYSSGYGSGYGARSSGGAGSALGGLVCILLVVAVVVVLVVMFKRNAAGSGGVSPDTPPPPPPPPMPRRPEVDEALGRIRQRDPGFDEAGFLNGVATSFGLVQRAWCEQLPAESRKVMADGVWLRHRTQIEEMAAAGRRNVLEDLHIGRSEIIDCVTDADSDSITVRIHAYSRDYDVLVPPGPAGPTPDGGQIVRGDRVVRLWTEDWTFTRSSSATTKAGSGTRQVCPNCGAPLDLDAAGTCAYCKQLVMAGAYDWVLSRIEQVYATG